MKGYSTIKSTFDVLLGGLHRPFFLSDFRASELEALGYIRGAHEPGERRYELTGEGLEALRAYSEHQLRTHLADYEQLEARISERKAEAVVEALEKFNAKYGSPRATGEGLSAFDTADAAKLRGIKPPRPQEDMETWRNIALGCSLPLVYRLGYPDPKERYTLDDADRAVLIAGSSFDKAHMLYGNVLLHLGLSKDARSKFSDAVLYAFN